MSKYLDCRTSKTMLWGTNHKRVSTVQDLILDYRYVDFKRAIIQLIIFTQEINFKNTKGSDRKSPKNRRLSQGRTIALITESGTTWKIFNTRIERQNIISKLELHTKNKLNMEYYFI